MNVDSKMLGYVDTVQQHKSIKLFFSFLNIFMQNHRTCLPSRTPPPCPHAARNCAQPHSLPTLVTFIVNQGVSRAGQGSVRGARAAPRILGDGFGGDGALLFPTRLADPECMQLGH